MQVRYISDLHLYDLYCWDWRKGFDEDFNIFNDCLISHWNDVCDDDTMVIIVGDVGACCTMTFDVLKQLHGVKILVLGNHDSIWGAHAYRSDLFAGTHDYIERNGVYIKHHPEFTPQIRARNSYLVHGHHHEYDSYAMLRARRKYSLDTCRLNCAADLVNFTPRTLAELITIKEKMFDVVETVV